MGNGILVLADFRERGSALRRALEAHPGIDLRHTHLPTGDYVVAGWVTVERKTVRDLLRSLRDGRLFRQAARLKRCAERPVLLVEGTWPPGPRAAVGALSVLSVMWYLPVLWAPSPRDSATMLFRIGRWQRRDTRGFYLHPNRIKRDLDALKVDLVRRLPGIGTDLATRPLAHFGSIDRVMRAPAAALREIPGIGRQRARAIRAFLEASARLEAGSRRPPPSQRGSGATTG